MTAQGSRQAKKALASVLLVRLDHVGDCVMTVPPVAHAIKESSPETRIDVLTTARSACLLQRDPAFHAIMVYDAPWSVRPEGMRRTPRLLYIRRIFRLLLMSAGRTFRGYDVVIYLSHSHWEKTCTAPVRGLKVGFEGPYRGRRYRVAGKLLSRRVRFDAERHQLQNCYALVESVLPLKSKPMASEIVLSDEDRAHGMELLRGSGDVSGLLVGIHPGGGRFRNWPNERYGELAARLAGERGATVLVISGPDERWLAEKVVGLAGGGPVRCLTTADYHEFATIASHLSLFVGNDAGPAHIAAYVGVPTVAIFGPTNHKVFAPLGEHVRVVRKSISCAPCRVPWERPVACDKDRRCLLDISVSDVFEAASDLLDAARSAEGKGE